MTTRGAEPDPSSGSPPPLTGDAPGTASEPAPEPATEVVEVARDVTERGELVLRRRRAGPGPAVWELRANGVFVMDSLELSSERALARSALALVAEPRDVLVGGLGLGFTAHEVLADPRVARCTIVEIEQALVGWMRDGTVPHGQAVLADERVDVVVADVTLALAEGPAASYDVVLLDVDNGPHFLVHEENARLYEHAFLGEARRVLRPGGVLAVWSMDEAPELLERLAEAFDEAEALPQPVRLQDRDEHYWLLVGRVGQPNAAR